MAESSETKEFAPSQRRLEEARRRGDLPISRDLTAAAATGGLLLAIWVWPRTAELTARSLQAFLADPESFSSDPAGALTPLLARVFVLPLPWLLLPAVVVLLSLIAQQALVVASSRLAPKLNRISPIAGFKRRFGLTGLVDFLRSLLKTGLTALLLVFCLLQESERLLNSAALSTEQSLLLATRLLGRFLIWIFLMQLAIALADLVWQRFDHQRKQRMTRREMTDELRRSEGDPHLKAHRRRRSEEIATRRMLMDVPKASVVVVNPEHYAVALAWQRGDQHAPVCLAKGTDEIALRIREAATQAGVPIRRDPPTARALFAAVRIGDEVRPEHYKAVAAAIRYAEMLTRRARRRARPW